MMWNLTGVYNSDENKKGLFENHILFIFKKNNMFTWPVLTDSPS